MRSFQKLFICVPISHHLNLNSIFCPIRTAKSQIFVTSFLSCPWPKGFSTKKFFFLRFLPAYVKLQEELKNNTIGDVYSVNVLFGENITSDRVFKKELGGGSVLDIGVYCIQVQTRMTRLEI